MRYLAVDSEPDWQSDHSGRSDRYRYRQSPICLLTKTSLFFSVDATFMLLSMRKRHGSTHWHHQDTQGLVTSAIMRYSQRIAMIQVEFLKLRSISEFTETRNAASSPILLEVDNGLNFQQVNSPLKWFLGAKALTLTRSLPRVCPSSPLQCPSQPKLLLCYYPERVRARH